MREIAADDQKHSTITESATNGGAPKSADSFMQRVHPQSDFSGRENLSKEVSVPSRVPLLLLTVMVVIAAILRIVATHNDLWLDELISLDLVSTVKTPWQIFTAIHSDNNHYLNSLYLYFLGNQDYPVRYRYLSVFCGVSLVPAGYWLLSRRSRVEGLILAGIFACSYPFIHFSSEARGYAGALLGTTLACAALARWLSCENGSRRSFWLGLTYGAALVLAILSHLTACLIWLPLAAGSLSFIAGKHQIRRRIFPWIALNLLPAAVLAVLYLVDLRFMTQLGGPPMNPVYGLGRLLEISLGWRVTDALTPYVLVVLLAGIAAWQLAVSRKSNEPLSILLPLIYLASIACTLLLIHTPFFSARYFLVVLPFVYAGAAIMLARLFKTPGGRVSLGIVLILFLAGEMYFYAKFLPVGRGQFTAALEYIKARTPSTRLILTSNQDFRSRIELTYYGPRVFRNWQILYVPQGSRALQPEWYIFHAEGYEKPGPAILNIDGQPTWYRAAYFGASELSGQAWTIYAHQPMK